MIRLIACDLDGTVLDDRKIADTGLKDAMEKLAERGVGLTFVSGRNEELITPYVDEFQIEVPYVTNNGGNVYRKHQCLYNDFIPREYNEILAGMLEEEGIAFRLFSLEGYYAYKETAFFSSRMDLFRKIGLIPYDRSLDLKDLHIYKITCDFASNEDRIPSFLERVAENCPQMNFLKAETGVYCANSLTANKGNALKRICEILGIGMDEVMAFGDNGNDLSMLEEAGVSVAMGNSSAEIRDRCDHVCGDNNHNGVSAFLNDYFKL